MTDFDRSGAGYQIVAAHSDRGFYVNVNRWNDAANCYEGRERATTEKFSTRAAAEAWVAEAIASHDLDNY